VKTLIKVIIVDDVVILRNGLKILIEQDPDIQVVACCGNGLDAVDICKQHSPDVVLMDIRMPVCDGVEGTKLIKKMNSTIKIIILTIIEDAEKIAEAIKNGADGVLFKDIQQNNLISAIKSTMDGLNIIQQSIFDNIKPRRVEIAANESNNKIHLTEREKDIIRLIVDGKSNREIALTLNLAEGSIRNAITIILDKFSLKGRTQLAIFMIKNDLL
jgi:DNA-binding NarL/FixJ family response regulator